MSNKLEATFHGGVHTEPWRPTVREGETPAAVPLNQWVGEALGAASMCWVGGTGNLEFDSTKCTRIGEALIAHIDGLFAEFVREADARRRISDAFLRQKYQQTKPALGLATTQELLEELAARGEVPQPEWSQQGKVNAAEMAHRARMSLAQLPRPVLDYSTVQEAEVGPAQPKQAEDRPEWRAVRGG